MSSHSGFLDFVRFFSAELVVVGHVSVLTPNLNLPLIFLASVGVFLFFVLSGFLISQSVLSKLSSQGYSFRVYFIDRFARIFSALVPCLVLISLFGVVHASLDYSHYWKAFGSEKTLSIGAFAVNLFMLQGYPVVSVLNSYDILGFPLVEVSHFGDAITLWTLSIEWWLYLLFGWLVIKRKSLFENFGLPSFLPLLAFSIPVYHFASQNPALVLAWILGAVLTFVFFRMSSRRGQALVATGPDEPFDVAGLAKRMRLTIPKLNLDCKKPALLFVSLLALRVWMDLHFNIALISDPVLAVLVGLSFAFVLLALDGFKEAFSFFEANSKKFGFLAGFSYTLYLLHFSVISFFFVLNPPVPPAVGAVLAFAVANMFSFSIAYSTEVHHKSVARALKRFAGRG